MPTIWFRVGGTQLRAVFRMRKTYSRPPSHVCFGLVCSRHLKGYSAKSQTDKSRTTPQSSENNFLLPLSQYNKTWHLSLSVVSVMCL